MEPPKVRSEIARTVLARREIILGFGDIAKLCTNALDAAGDAVEGKLSSLSAPGKLSAGDGSCLAVENMGHTGNADTLSNGAWALTLPAGSANLTLPGTFTGTRH